MTELKDQQRWTNKKQTSVLVLPIWRRLDVSVNPNSENKKEAQKNRRQTKKRVSKTDQEGSG